MSKHKEKVKKVKAKAAVYYLKVFTYINEAYQETESSSSCVSYDGFYKALTKNADTSSTGKLFVSPSDFIADVQLAVKSLTTRAEYSSFLEGECPEYLREKIGQEFIKRKLHPLSEYLKPIAIQVIYDGRTRN